MIDHDIQTGMRKGGIKPENSAIDIDIEWTTEDGMDFCVPYYAPFGYNIFLWLL